MIIVGGGAVGCALAWEGTSRGLSTALLERDDFGASTSANSLGIIHGGLRYLQKFDLRRARASARERANMLRIAPHLISPLKCAIPTLRSLTRSRMALAAGLELNRWLTAGQNRALAQQQELDRCGIMSSAEIFENAPGLAEGAVTGGAYWHDAQMSGGERLALAFALSAKERGAVVLNHVEVEAGLSMRGQITGVVARDRLTDDTFQLDSSVVVDCRGVGLSSQTGVLGDSHLDIEFIKAVNIIVDEKGLGCAIGAPARDAGGNPDGGRLIFARPVGRTTIVGTWYFADCEADEKLSRSELEQILGVVNGAFPGWKVSSDDVLGAHVGFLPRADDTQVEPQPIDKPIVVEAASNGGLEGLWHLQTEKWTTVRALAESFVNRLSEDGRVSAAPSRTEEQILYGGGSAALTADQSTLLSTLSPTQASRITTLYGEGTGQVLDFVLDDPSLCDPVPAASHVIQAEVLYVIGAELALTPEDVVRRLLLNQEGTPAPDTMSFLGDILRGT